ncbi:MAG: CHAT domain-containing protein [Calditrichia bacterium]
MKNQVIHLYKRGLWWVLFFQIAIATGLFAQPAARDAIIKAVYKADSAAALFAQNSDDILQKEAVLSAFREALLKAESVDDFLASAAICNMVGNFYEVRSEYQRGLGYFEKGLKILETKNTTGAENLFDDALSDLQSSSKGYNSGAGFALVTDLYSATFDDFGDFLAQNPTKTEARLSVMLLLNAGNMYLQQSQFSQSQTLYSQALQIAKRSGLVSEERHISANIAWSYIKNNQLDSAKTLLDALLSEQPDAQISNQLRQAYLARGAAFREEGDFPAAIADIKQSLVLYQTASDSRGYCRALAHLASTYFESGDIKTATDYYHQTLTKNATVNDEETAWHANGGLAKCYSATGDDEKALAYFKTYFDIVESLGGRFSTDQGKVSFLENQTAFLNDYARTAINVSLKNNDFSIARPVIEKLRGSSLAALRQTKMGSKPPISGTLPLTYLESQSPQSFYEFSIGTANNNSNMMAQTSIGITSNQLFPGTISQPDPEIEQKLSQGIASEMGETAVANAPENLPAVTFLEYFLLDNQIAILTKSPENDVNGAVVPVSPDSLDALINEYRSALHVQQSRGITASRNAVPIFLPTDVSTIRSHTKLAQQLFQLLIAPIRQSLPYGGGQTLVIIPHRSLWIVPFASLLDKNEQYFGDQFVLTYAPSEQDWASIAAQQRPADQRDPKAWIIGNPQMPQLVQSCGLEIKFSQLSGAEDEAKAIAQLFGRDRSELFIGKQADRLRLEAWHQDFSVLHFATHGFACIDDPLSSFVVLSELEPGDIDLQPQSAQLAFPGDPRLAVKLNDPNDDLSRMSAKMAPPKPEFPGILDARTIVNHFFLKADLVTLSACQTGLGKVLGQGTIGFTRAFLAAGARSLLVSLWQVDDESTKELMIHFYTEYLRHGNKALALQNAMIETRKKFPDPKDWAAFTLIGTAE